MFGCTDSLAFNYDSSANVDNGGCIPIVIGCMDAFALNYNPLANTPGTCIPFIYGCTNPLALNYDPLANTDDNSCITIVLGCMDPNAFNYNPLANSMEYIDQCSYDLILHDLVGNGWVGTRLEIYQDDDTSIFIMKTTALTKLFHWICMHQLRLVLNYLLVNKLNKLLLSVVLL